MEIILLTIIGALLAVDIHLSFACYEKYVTLPNLRKQRAEFLNNKYQETKVWYSKRRKAVCDKIRRSPMVTA